MRSVYRIHNSNFDILVEAESNADAVAVFARNWPELAHETVTVQKEENE